MSLRDLLLSASESIRRNKSRSLLTILGIVIGIASVILMLSIGQGAEGYILGQVADLGSDLVFIEPSSGSGTNGPPDPFVQQSLDMKDVEVMRRSGLFSFVSPAILSTFSVSHEEQSKFAQVAGVDGDYLAVFPAQIADGRFLDQSDVDSYAKVAVLGQAIAADLFGDQDPIGFTIKIKKTPFRVIGVFDKQGTRFFQNLDQRIAVPVTTAQRELFGVDYVNFITGRAAGDIEFTKQETRFVFRDTHKIDNPEGDLKKDNFLVSSQEDAVESISAIGGALTIFLSSIAAISLIVGGIGIMNIMLVSVTERTREIGLRKAIGATPSQILRQFLIEAVLLTMLGGLIGIVLGVSLSALMATILAHLVGKWDFAIPFTAIGASFTVATIVGLIFGIYPARRAARLDPIEALRYE